MEGNGCDIIYWASFQQVVFIKISAFRTFNPSLGQMQGWREADFSMSPYSFCLWSSPTQKVSDYVSKPTRFIQLTLLTVPCILLSSSPPKAKFNSFTSITHLTFSYCLSKNTPQTQLTMRSISLKQDPLTSKMLQVSSNSAVVRR